MASLICSLHPISVWHLSQPLQPWATLAYCWDVQQSTSKQTSMHCWSRDPAVYFRVFVLLWLWAWKVDLAFCLPPESWFVVAYMQWQNKMEAACKWAQTSCREENTVRKVFTLKHPGSSSFPNWSYTALATVLCISLSSLCTGAHIPTSGEGTNERELCETFAEWNSEAESGHKDQQKTEEQRPTWMGKIRLELKSWDSKAWGEPISLNPSSPLVDEKASLVCSLYLSVEAHTLVLGDPFLRCTLLVAEMFSKL